MARRNVNDTQENARERERALRTALVLDREDHIFADEADAGLTAQQWTAIAMLAGGARQIEVATQLDVRQETVSRWKCDPRFVAALNLAIREHYAAIEGTVRSAAAEAMDVLRETLKSDDPRLRLSAALSVLRLHSGYTVDASSLPTTPADVAREELHEREAKARRDLFI